MVRWWKGVMVGESKHGAKSMEHREMCMEHGAQGMGGYARSNEQGAKRDVHYAWGMVQK